MSAIRREESEYDDSDDVPDDDESVRRREEFYALANARFEAFLASGEGIAWEGMCAYLQDCIDGKSAKPPKPKKLDP